MWDFQHFHGGESGRLGDDLEQFLLIVVKGANLAMILEMLCSVIF
jgi:hypothetical protein